MNDETDRRAAAVLLIAHGSRRPEANADLLSLAEQVRARSNYGEVATAYLELAEPDVLTAGRECLRRGSSTLLMLPWFLSAGAHVVEDLARIRDQLEAEFPAARIRLCPPLGLHPLMTEIVLARLEEGEKA